MKYTMPRVPTNGLGWEDTPEQILTKLGFARVRTPW